MYQYDDPEKTTITVMGTKYRAVAWIPYEQNCGACVFDSPACKLLLGIRCSQIPCLPDASSTTNGVFFTEIPDDSV